MADIDSISKNFVDYYYQTFDLNRQALAPLYKQESMLSFQGDQVKGQVAIIDKLQNLSFQKIQHIIHSNDAQPSNNNCIIVNVCGELLTEGEEHPLKFSQSFQLAPEAGSYWVANDIFRLV